MGLFFRYGIEYHVVLRNGTIIKLVEMKNADARLLQSKYYQSRKQKYENEIKEWSEEAINCDCELTTAELGILKKILNVHGSDVIKHGWVDIKEIISTLE
jgi:hypothetical protein